MPRVPDGVLDCVIYLYRTVNDAEQGIRIGGSGFLINVPSAIYPNLGYIYAITNSHVIREANAPVIRMNTQDGGFDVLDIPVENWVHHEDGDDLAAIPVAGLSHDHFKFKFFSDDFLVTEDAIREFNIGPGDETIMIGRFINHEGRQRNTPSCRFGNIAMMPLEPIVSERGIRQESFLVETHSIGGYSGSPVFVYISPFDARVDRMRRDQGEVRRGPWLLGVDWCHLTTEELVLDASRNLTEERFRVEANAGMAGVIPAWKLRQLLDQKELRMPRDESERRLIKEKEQGAVALDASEANERFIRDDFLRDLTKVTRPVEPSDQGSSGTSA